MISPAQLLVACALFVLGPGPAGADEMVDVELLLAIDVSRSIEQDEYEIQQQGYASALTDPAVIAAMLGGAYGQVALSVIEWAGDQQLRIVVPWQLVASPADATRVAGMVMGDRPRWWRRTSISNMLIHAGRMFEANGFSSTRQIIDVSGDGPNNEGLPVLEARAAVLARGIVINGLPLLTRSLALSMFELDDLDRYYQDCVIGGPGSFVMPVTRWSDFAQSVRRKLVLELSGGVPPARFLRAATVDCMIGESIWRDRNDFYGGP